MSPTLQTVALTVLGNGVIAYFVVRWALSRYLWEKKYEAYVEAFTLLHTMSKHVWKFAFYAGKDESIVASQGNEYLMECDRLVDEVWRVMDVADFVWRPQSTKIVEGIMKTVRQLGEQVGPGVDHTKAISKTYAIALQELKASAAIDLRRLWGVL